MTFDPMAYNTVKKNEGKREKIVLAFADIDRNISHSSIYMLKTKTKNLSKFQFHMYAAGWQFNTNTTVNTAILYAFILAIGASWSQIDPPSHISLWPDENLPQDG